MRQSTPPLVPMDVTMLLKNCYQENYNTEDGGLCECYPSFSTCLSQSNSTDCDFFGFYSWVLCEYFCGDLCGEGPAAVTYKECASGSWCTPDGTCGAESANGQPCSDPYTCASGACEYGISGSAACVGFQWAGDSCVYSYDCASESCSSGFCTGFAAGAECFADEQCNFGYWCGYNYTCQPQVAVGQPCFEDDQCFGGFSLCSYNYSCFNVFSGAAGSKCNTPFECQMGLTCNVSGLCGTPQANLGEVCDDSLECEAELGVSAECVCNVGSGTLTCSYVDTFPSSCQTPFAEFITCANNANCSNTDPLDPNSCATARCSSSLVCATVCSLDNPYNSQLVGAGCFPAPSGVCPGVPSPSTGSTGTTGTTKGTTGAASGSTGTASLTTTGHSEAPSTVVYTSLFVLLVAILSLW